MSSKGQCVRGWPPGFLLELAGMNYLKPKTYSTLAVAMATGIAFTTTVTNAADSDWKAGLISPVANPIYFEDPRITSEVRPIFMQHWLPERFDIQGGSVALDGEVRVYALQLRYALTEKLGFIATKDGYIEFKPKGALANNHAYGFADIAAGLKYALVDDAERQLLITPGFTITLPTGDDEVFQGDGDGEWNLFVSAAKGFTDFHVLGNFGFRIPNNFDDQTAQAHYNLQLDYRICDYFIPFVTMSGYTILSEGNDRLLGAVPLNTEMYDLINFGSTDAGGRTQIVLGGGFRSHLTKDIDVGVAYEAGVTSLQGIFGSRLTMDMIFRF
jgi:hypothetical protein